MSRYSGQVQDDQVEVKKIVPYPFFVDLTTDSGALKGDALKLVMHGLMLELKAGVVKVGDQYTIQFDLPAGMGKILTEVKIIKTYDRKVPGKDGVQTQRLAEVHFVKPLRDSQKEKVKEFLKRIRQTGSDLV